jgi:hypothetical protein
MVSGVVVVPSIELVSHRSAGKSPLDKLVNLLPPAPICVDDITVPPLIAVALSSYSTELLASADDHDAPVSVPPWTSSIVAAFDAEIRSKPTGTMP